MMRALMALMLMLMAACVRADEWETAIGQTEQVTSGLVGYWAMRNSGATVYDEWTGGINGTASNGVTFADTHGAVGHGATFDGVDDHITFGDVLDFGAGQDFAVSFWMRTSSATAAMILIRKQETSDFPGWQLYLDAGRIRLLFRATALINSLFSATDYRDGAWHHVAVVFDRDANAICYVDGAAIGAITISAQSGDLSNAQSLRVPHFAAGLNGSMDEVRIYNRAITTDEVKQLYRMGALPRGIK